MSQNRRARSLLAPRRHDRELVLAPAGDGTLTLEALERQCLARLTRLVADTAIWRREDYGITCPDGSSWTNGSPCSDES